MNDELNESTICYLGKVIKKLLQHEYMMTNRKTWWTLFQLNLNILSVPVDSFSLTDVLELIHLNRSQAHNLVIEIYDSSTEIKIIFRKSLT